MTWGNLLVKGEGGRYYMREDAAQFFQDLRKSGHMFHPYSGALDTSTITKLRPAWFKYVETRSQSKAIAPKPARLLKPASTPLVAPKDTKDIGDKGESLILIHEQLRIAAEGRPDLTHLIKLIPSHYAVGYDIDSLESDESKRCVEVKTSQSHAPLSFNRFHLTTNEWVTAESYGDRYFVYRLQVIEGQDYKLLTIRNPVQLYKQSKLKMVPRHGADIIFQEECGECVDLLEATV
jgi:hypothetical protein